MNNDGIKAVALDVDGTLIDSSVWKALHALFGVTSEEDEHLNSMYMSGSLTFRGVTDEMAKYYLRKNPKPTKADIDAVLANFRFVPEAEEVVRALGERYYLALVSSGFSDYVFQIAEMLGIPHAYAFTAVAYSADGRFAGISYNEPGNELEAKVNALKKFGTKVGAKPEEIVFVGDSINDLAAFRHTGHGILVGDSTEELGSAAWKRVDALPEVLAIL